VAQHSINKCHTGLELTADQSQRTECPQSDGCEHSADFNPVAPKGDPGAPQDCAI